jgi:6-pyruvoyltetrahydropterin/6-carboxytetrahydropterin synthase
MFRVSREIHFCYGHRLLNYAGKCRHLHGHNAKVIVTLQSDALDSRGMVLDFGEIKQSLSVWIDEALDHRMVLHQDDPAVPAMHQLGEPVFLMDKNPTAENIAQLIFERGRELGLPIVEVRLWETPHCFANYCP